MASYVPLFFFFRSPLSNLPFLLTFIKIRCNFRTYKPNPRDNWAGLMWVSCDTTRAWSARGRWFLARGREGTEGGGVEGIQRMRKS
jgi:hypothetical protein